METANNRFIDTTQASIITGMSVAWFEKQRLIGQGPPTYKIGRRSVRYLLPELLDWFAAWRCGEKT